MHFHIGRTFNFQFNSTISNLSKSKCVITMVKKNVFNTRAKNTIFKSWRQEVANMIIFTIGNVPVRETITANTSDGKDFVI